MASTLGTSKPKRGQKYVSGAAFNRMFEYQLRERGRVLKSFVPVGTYSGS